MDGLELIPLLSRAEQKFEEIATWPGLEQLVGDFIQDGKVVAYLNYKVLIGKIDQGRLEFYEDEEFNPKYLLQLRAFDPDREFYIYRKNLNRFLLRYRTDGAGESVEAVETKQILWGRYNEAVSLQTGWVRLSEKRGVELTLPYDQRLKQGTSIWLKTRNYIGYNDIHQAGYIDSRFVKFEPEEVDR
jgi:CRISPR-associated protein (TIGR03984 family)